MDRIGQQIQIKGQENVDWRWWYPPYLPDDQKYVAGIEFVIDPHSRAWIPPGKEPIQIADGPAANHSRTTVDQYLQRPVPQLDNDSILCIAETLAELTLDPSIHGLVDMCVARNGAVIGSHDTHDFQANSVLIQGGNTYGRVRTETFSPTTPNKIAQTALIRFVRAW